MIMNIFVTVGILVTVNSLFISAVLPAALIENNENDVEGVNGGTEEYDLHLNIDLLSQRRFEPYSHGAFPRSEEFWVEKKKTGLKIKSEDNIRLFFGRDSSVKSTNSSHKIGLIGGNSGDDELISVGNGVEPSSVTYRYNDVFEIEEAATSNSWYGPAAGTGDMKWRCMTSDSQGINLAAGTDSSGVNKGVYYSRNGGSSWVQSTGPPTSLSWGAIVSSSTGQFVVAGNSQLYTSIDYGQTFTQALLYTGGVGGLAMSTDGTKLIAAVGGQGVLLYNLSTVLAGSVTQVGTTYTNTNAACVSSDSSLVKLAFGTYNGGIYYSSDSGSSWLQSDAPNKQWYVITSSANGKYLAAGTGLTGIYYSQDSGATWVYSTNAPSGVDILGIACSASGQTMIAALNRGGASNGRIINLSFNYGQSWQASNSPARPWVGVAISEDGGTMYGGPDVGGIYKSFAVPSSRPTSNPSTSTTSQPTPSPSNPSSQPSIQPSSRPTPKPTPNPSAVPTASPSTNPTPHPSHTPSMSPTTAAPTVNQQMSDANALCAFKAGITNWPGACAASITSGWTCNGVTATSVACTSSTSTWSGVNCLGNAVLGLSFASCGFAGTISSQMSKLNKIQNIHLHSNNFASTIPMQMSALSALDSLYLNNNNLTGPAGSFLCTSAMSSADPLSHPLQIENNKFSCIASCVQNIAGSGYYDTSTPVCTVSPSYSPSASPTTYPSPNPTAEPTTSSPSSQSSPAPTYSPTESTARSSRNTNDDGSVKVNVATESFYIVILVVFLLISVLIGYLIEKGRLKHKKDSINEVSRGEIYFWPVLAYLFFGNWIYSIIISFITAKSVSAGLIIVNILSVLVRLSTILLVFYIQKYINDPVSSFSLFHKVHEEKSISLEESQSLFLLVSFNMYVNTDSVKILPWKRNTFTAVSGGYPCYWLFAFSLKYQIVSSIFCLILVLARLALLNEISITNIMNVVFTFLYIISLGSSNVYAIIRGKLLEEYEMFDDDDDIDEKRKFADRPQSTGNQEMIEFRPTGILNSSDILKEAQNNIEAENAQGVFDIDVIADRFNVILAEQEAIKEQEAIATAVTTKEDTDVLENQLKELGIEPLRFIKLDEIRAEVAVILQRQDSKQKNDDKRLDYLLRCMNVNPEYIEEKKQERLIWIQEALPKFSAWFQEMTKFVPTRVNKLSVTNLVQAGLPQKLANRLHMKKCLWLIKMDPEMIRKIHISDLRGKYSYQSQGLDIVELAAIYMSLPQSFEDDGRGDKMRFKTELEDKLKVMYREKKTDRNPVYMNVDMSQVGLDVNSRLTFSGNSEKPTLAELAEIDLEALTTDNPMLTLSNEIVIGGFAGVDDAPRQSHAGHSRIVSSGIFQKRLTDSLNGNRTSLKSDSVVHSSPSTSSTHLDDMSTPLGLIEQSKHQQQSRKSQVDSNQTTSATASLSISSSLSSPTKSRLSAPPGLMEQLKQKQSDRRLSAKVNTSNPPPITSDEGV